MENRRVGREENRQKGRGNMQKGMIIYIGWGDYV